MMRDDDIARRLERQQIEAAERHRARTVHVEADNPSALCRPLDWRHLVYCSFYYQVNEVCAYCFQERQCTLTVVRLSDGREGRDLCCGGCQGRRAHETRAVSIGPAELAAEREEFGDDINELRTEISRKLLKEVGYVPEHQRDYSTQLNPSTHQRPQPPPNYPALHREDGGHRKSRGWAVCRWLGGLLAAWKS